MTRIALALGLLFLASCTTGPVPVNSGAAPSAVTNPITGTRGGGGGNM